MACPVALLASRRIMTLRSIMRGTNFSIPIQAMCSGGSETPKSAFPSLVQTTIPPVSATAKLTPVIPASASRNRLRNSFRAASRQELRVRTAFGCLQMLMKSLANVLFRRWMAGKTMWLGGS